MNMPYPDSWAIKMAEEIIIEISNHKYFNDHNLRCHIAGLLNKVKYQSRIETLCGLRAATFHECADRAMNEAYEYMHSMFKYGEDLISPRIQSMEDSRKERIARDALETFSDKMRKLADEERKKS